MKTFLSKKTFDVEQKIEVETDGFHIKFDDPPGPSPARFVGPLPGVDKVQPNLEKLLKEKVPDLYIIGIYSGAYSDESYTAIIFLLGGLAGGLFEAIGQDVWNAIKKSVKQLLGKHGSHRNIMEVILDYSEMDVIFHYESRNFKKLPNMLDEVESVLEELKHSLDNSDRKKHILEAKSIELRRQPSGVYACIRYSYRRSKKITKKDSK